MGVFGWDYPPGVSESSLPGVNDIEVEVSVECPYGDCPMGEFIIEVTLDAQARESEWEAECPECGSIIRGVWSAEFYEGDES